MPEQQFALRFPFRPLHRIEGFDEPVRVAVGDVEVTVSAAPPFIILSAEPFANEKVAREFLPHLWGAVAWMSIKVGTGFVAETQIDPVTYSEDPYKAAENLHKSLGLPNTGPVHGIVTGNLPSILQIGKNIRFALVGDGGSVSQSLAKQQIEAPLTEGLLAPGPGSLYADARLRLAVELFCDHHRESSVRSKFLTLVTALEVLTEPRPKHPVAQQLLDRLEEQVMEGLAAHPEDSDEKDALESLRREILFRRETSIRSRVRQLVLSSLCHLTPTERKAHARDAIWAYDLRGGLIHDGSVSNSELSKAYAIARSTLIDILAARMQHVGKLPTDPSG